MFIALSEKGQGKVRGTIRGDDTEFVDLESQCEKEFCPGKDFETDPILGGLSYASSLFAFSPDQIKEMAKDILAERKKA